MNHSKLKHSFDEIRLSDEKKRAMLTRLKSPGSTRSSGWLLRPAMVMALVAFMFGGLYLGSRFLQDPGQGFKPGTASTDTGVTASSTTPEVTEMPDLSVPRDTLVRLAQEKRHAVTPEQWQTIREILARAVFEPKINGVTADLRANDLNLTSQDKSYYFVRDFREIYYMNEDRFEAWSLSDGDSSLLEQALRDVMESEIISDDPSGELSLLSRLDRPHDTVRHLMDSLEYRISGKQWENLAAILKSATYKPEINGVTDDLRDTDLYLMGDFSEYLFLRDYRELYLSGSDRFAAYSLSEAQSTALKELLAEVMIKGNLKNPPVVTEPPTVDLTTIPGLDNHHFRLLHPMSDQDYFVSPEQWKVITEILLRAKHEPDWNAVTEELRDTDLHLFDSSEEHLFIRDYREIYLTGADRFVGYSLTEPDGALLRAILDDILSPDNRYSGQGEGIRPQDLPYTRMSWKDDPGINLTESGQTALRAILERADYVAALGMVELAEAIGGKDSWMLFSEEPELIFTRITVSGDVFIETGIAMSVDTRRNYHYRLAPDDLTEFLRIAGKILAGGE